MTHGTQAPQPASNEGDERRIEAAQQYVKQLQAFYVHAGVFAAGMVVMFVVNLATNE